MDNGDTVLNCRLTSVALASINADDRSVARSACAYFVLAAAHDETYKLTNIRQSVIPKLLSAIRKKHRTWSFLAQSIKKLLESFSGRISNDEWKKFLCNVIESFMDGLPWETSFELSSWETSFIECGRFAIQSLSEDDEHLIRVLTQIARSVEVVVWSKNARLCKTLANYYLEILSCEVPSTAISRFRACLFENIVNKLPESSSVAEQLFSRPTDQHLLPLAFSVIGNVSSPPSLLTGLIDRSDDDFIRSLLAKGDCRKIIADRIIFLPEQTAIGLMQTYLRLTHLANGQLSEHFPGGDDVISRTIVAAAVGWNNWNVLKFIVDDEYWKNLEERAIATTVSESESRVWSLMVSAMEHSDNQEHLISKVIENVNANSYRNLFDLCRIVCKMPPSCKLKVLAAVLGFVLEEENAGEVIERSVPFTNEIHVDCNQLANLIYSKLFNAQSIMIKQAEFHSNAVSYVSCLPAQLVCGFMIEKDELVSSTSQIDSMLGAEILDSYEFLSSAVDRTLSNDKKFLKDCCIKSSFILDVLQHADKNATELSSAITLSLAYITAVSFSLSCSPTTSSSITDIELPALEAKLTSFLKVGPKTFLLFYRNNHKLLSSCFPKLFHLISLEMAKA
ncbi:hypothetical protein AB6A40_007858 [Gnathostoma spinigerum]|uniref:Uncharacterized protein n=1 Tax=Gnathostoma spinigerum TaxID=75299 RepID=A0ABD6EMG2_9BILA